MVLYGRLSRGFACGSNVTQALFFHTNATILFCGTLTCHVSKPPSFRDFCVLMPLLDSTLLDNKCAHTRATQSARLPHPRHGRCLLEPRSHLQRRQRCQLLLSCAGWRAHARVCTESASTRPVGGGRRQSAQVSNRMHTPTRKIAVQSFSANVWVIWLSSPEIEVLIRFRGPNQAFPFSALLLVLKFMRF